MTRFNSLPAACASSLLFLLAACGNEPETPPQAADTGTPKSAPASGEFEVIDMLMDFDDGALPPGLASERADATLVDETDGGKALRLDFFHGDDMPGVRIRPEEPWNWGELDDIHIAFEAHNPGEKPIQFYFHLTAGKASDNGFGASASRSSTLAAGETRTFYAVLNGLINEIDTGFKYSSLPPWESQDEMLIFRNGRRDIPLDNITEMGFSVRGTLENKALEVDNIRLRKNPAYDASFLADFVDEFGQNARKDFPIKVHSERELKAAADKELAELAASGPMPDRSRWNGWKDGPQFEGTGYFRTQKVDGKWWLVDPDGYLFFTNGLANVRMANLTTITGIDFRDESVRYIDPEELTPEDSIGIVYVSEQVRETAYVASEVRHNMFTWLPEYNDPLADHYSYRRSVIMGAIPSGETFSFYRANLERRYGETEPESYIRKWEEVTLDRQLHWGFTSFGNWVDPAFYPNQKVPYFANGWIIGDFKVLASKYDIWAPMPDPFDPEFVRRADVTIKQIADEIQGSPWCVGVFVDNEKSWGRSKGTVEQRYGIILDGLSRNAADSPAKAAFTGYLREKYGDIADVNGAWETSIASWDELAAGVEFPAHTDALAADLSVMLEMVSNEYFKTVHDALEHYLPNHLYMGVRMASWGMPAETVKAAVKYSDVLSFNIYKEGVHPETWGFLKDIDLPAVIGEWHIGATSDTGLWHPGLLHAPNQADRAAMWTDYMESVLAHPNFVGAHWFQYVDSPISGRAFDGENYNVGFVSGTDIPYPEMTAAARAFNTTLYPRRYGKQ